MADQFIVTLKSSDNQIFKVEHAVAMESEMIKKAMEDIGIEAAISLFKVPATILAMVLDYCKYHVSARSSSISQDEIKKWDRDFLQVDLATGLDIMEAADYLNIKSLVDLTCKQVADMMKAKTPKQIRETFNIKNDLSHEEEEKLKHEFAWAWPLRRLNLD